MYGVESRTKPGAIEGQMELDDLLPEYQNGELVGWTCSRCGWAIKRDNSLLEIDNLARARAEFLDHSCSPSERSATE